MKLTIDFNFGVASAFFKAYEEAGGDGRIDISKPVDQVLFAIRTALTDLDKVQQNKQISWDEIHKGLAGGVNIPPIHTGIVS